MFYDFNIANAKLWYSVLKFQNSCALKHKHAVSYLENNRCVVVSYSVEEIA